MSGHGQLQAHQRLDVRAIEVKDALAEIKPQEGEDDPDEPQYRSDFQHYAHVPGLGLYW